jgi:hypothetical protein
MLILTIKVLILLLIIWVLFFSEPFNRRRQARRALKNAQDLSCSLLNYIIDEDGSPNGLAEALRMSSEAAVPLADAETAFRERRYSDCLNHATAASDLLVLGICLRHGLNGC